MVSLSMFYIGDEKIGRKREDRREGKGEAKGRGVRICVGGFPFLTSHCYFLVNTIETYSIL
jgi:hypothetical protein